MDAPFGFKAALKGSEALLGELAAAEKALLKMGERLRGLRPQGPAVPVQREGRPRDQGARERNSRSWSRASSFEMSDRVSQLSHLVSSVERAEAELAGRLAFEFKAPSKGSTLPRW